METTYDIEATRNSAFSQLKPHCVAVSQHALAALANPSASNRDLTRELDKLLEVVRRVSQTPNALTQAMGDYIFFPLSHVFRQYQKLSDRMVELSLQILSMLIETCWRINIPRELAKQLITLVTFIVGGQPGVKTFHTTSEECKIAGCACLVGLFRATSLSGFSKAIFLEDQNLPATGHLVLMLLDTLVESVDSVELGTISLQALEELLKHCLTDNDVLASFLPGVVSQFTKVLAPQKRSTRRPHTILTGTIELLGSVLYRTIADQDLSAAMDVEKGENEMDELKVTRNNSWFTATASQVKIALEGILARNRLHPKLDVRKSICSLCCGILTNCLKAVESSQALGLLVDTLVILSGDDSTELASFAGHSLQSLSVTIPVLEETLQQSVHGWVNSLPRVMQSNDEDMKSKVVKRISAGLRMLTTMGVQSEMLQDMVAHNIRDSLESTQAFSGKESIATHFHPGSELMLLQSPGSQEIMSTHYPNVILPHRTQRETVASLKELLQMIGETSSNAMLDLTDRYIREARDGSPISLWIALNLMRATLSHRSEEEQWLVMQDESNDAVDGLTEELFALSLDILADTTAATAYIPDESSNFALTTCLALEAISLIAEKHKESFRHELVDVVYPIVHLLGSPSPTISRHAMITLNNIAYCCEYRSAQDLILDNMDYLVNAISLKLNTFDISPQAPVVLGMIIKLVGKKIVPFLEDLLESIFAALGNYHGYEVLCRGLFAVLKDVVEVTVEGESSAVKMIENRNSGQVRSRSGILTKDQLLERLKQDFERRERAKLEAKELENIPDMKKGEFPEGPWGQSKEERKFDPETWLNEEMNDKDMPDADSVALPQAEKPPEPGQTYKMIQNITRLTQHYLTHPSPTLRLQLLQLVGASSTLLAQNEKEFLPLVNDVWPVLFTRLFDEEAHIVIGVAKTIGDLARVCGDFISSRVNDGWKQGGRGSLGGDGGGIGQLLRMTKAKVDKESKGRASRGVYSPDYRVWDALLGMLTDIVKGCKLEEDVFDEILEIVVDVLEERKGLKGVLEEVNEDAVWLELECKRSMTCAAMVDQRRWGPKPAVEGLVYPDIAF